MLVSKARSGVRVLFFGALSFTGVSLAGLLTAGCERSPIPKAGTPPPAPDVAPVEYSRSLAVAPAAAPPNTAPAGGPFQLAAACRGSCPVSLSTLAGERALALWADRDGTWAQRFDLTSGSSLGTPLSLGEIDEERLPYVIALPDGDAALFGVLRNGRVSFARGSDVAARRVAPKVVVPRGARGVRSLAAGATGSGLALLVLRQADEQALRQGNTPIDAELHWLDPQGKPLRDPLLWKPQLGVEARLAACGEQLYLAWSAVAGMLVTRISSSGHDRAEMLLPPPQAHRDAYPGPLLCTPTGARLLAGWKKSGDFQLEAKVSLAAISATEALPARGRWTTLPVPGVPQLSTSKESPVAVYPTSTGAQLLLEKDDQQVFLGLDPAAEKVAVLPEAPKLPSVTPCVPTSDGRRALCVESKASTPTPGCRGSVKRLTAFFAGDSPAASPSVRSAAPPVEQYFDAPGAGIPDPRAKSGEQEQERRAQLRCGEPGWEGLRKAIQGLCDDLGKQHAAGEKGKQAADEWEPGCGDEPSSLLFQATHCTDEPLVCEHASVSSILSVDRAEFEQGSELLIMKVGHCELHFAGKGDTWHAVGRECGD